MGEKESVVMTRGELLAYCHRDIVEYHKDEPCDGDSVDHLMNERASTQVTAFQSVCLLTSDPKNQSFVLRKKDLN